jgi:hypothetical protein
MILCMHARLLITMHAIQRLHRLLTLPSCVQGWQSERVVQRDGLRGRVLLVLPTDSAGHLRKVRRCYGKRHACCGMRTLHAPALSCAQGAGKA